MLTPRPSYAFMDREQTIVAAVLLVAFVFFVWGKWRYDAVALMALLVLVLTDIVPGEDAFRGFGHPAVVTVAGVLVVSRGFRTQGRSMCSLGGFRG